MLLPLVLAFNAVSLGSTPPPVHAPPFPVRPLAAGVYAVPGDSGRGSEGRPNAGFIVTPAGVVVIDALASPRDGRRLLASIRTVTRAPVRYLVLTHHHPDHHFGAIVFRRLGAKIIAHPDTRVLASEAGNAALVKDWTRVVGAAAMRGFAFADTPDIPVLLVDTLVLGGRTIVIAHPGAAHTAGDLTVWLPDDRILFAGDLLIEDGVTMIGDGSAAVLLRALDAMDTLHAAVVVPGHGRISESPAALIGATRTYMARLRTEMRAAVEHGVPMKRALASLPPPDDDRPVSLNSRRRRNAARVYVEEEKSYMGLDSAGTTP
ncbi:MAG: MBL fold metallo-hydrolase [Gemmatimonadales bacterium]|nr:MBL fold metallo-hydrolase [Gemmatimonadales bacterium]